MKKTKQKTKTNNSALYQALLHSPFNSTLAHLHSKLLTICPYESAYLQEIMSNMVNLTVWISTYTVLFNLSLNYIVTGKMTLYAILSSIFLVWVVYSIVTRRTLNKIQTKVESDFRTYISHVVHEYESSKNMSNAMIRATIGLSPEIEMLSDELRDVIWASNKKEKVAEYISDHHRPAYIREFVEQCYLCSTEGDVIDNGESLFKKHAEQIRYEMKRESINRMRKAYIYKGKTLVTVLPVILFSIFGRWGLKFAPDTEDFYVTYGYIIQFATLAGATIIFRIIEQSKDISARTFRRTSSFYTWLGTKMRPNLFTKKAEKKLAKMLLTVGETIPPSVFLLKMVVWSLAGIAVVATTFGVSLYAKRRQIINSTDVSSIIATANLKQQITKAVVEISDEHKKEDFSTYDDEYLSMLLSEKVDIRNVYTKGQTIDELRERNTAYRNISLSILQIIFLLLSPCIGFTPLFELRYYYTLFLTEQDNEIRLFRMLIMMEKDSPRVTTYNLLREMEGHSVLFRNVLTTVTMEYTKDKETALQLLQIGQPEEIKEMADNFLAAGKIGIRRAFSSIEQDMRITDAEKDLEKGIRTDNENDRMSLLIYIPFLLAIGGNFVLPFVMSSLKGVSQLFDMIQELEGMGF